MGVEPTKDRLAASAGFEVRTPHRGRFPSKIRCRPLFIRRGVEQIEPVLVHAAQIASPQRHAMAIEEFKNLDGDFATVVEPISKFGGGELPVRGLGCKIYGNFRHFRHGAAKEEMIVRHLVDVAKATEQLEERPEVSLAEAHHGSDVADARRPKALLASNQRFHLEPQHFLSSGQAYLMARQPNPSAIERQLLAPRQALQGHREGRCRQPRLELQPESLESHAG